MSKIFLLLLRPKYFAGLNIKGYRMVALNSEVLAKFGLCSNCSQKLDECTLVHARKVFASGRMLGGSKQFTALSETLSLSVRASFVLQS